MGSVLVAAMHATCFLALLAQQLQAQLKPLRRPIDQLIGRLS